MKKIIFTSLIFCLGICQFVFAQTFNSPESVEFDYANNRYLIANRAANQILARAADGTLSVFASLNGSPYGIEIVGDTLYCCTSGSLRGVNLNTGLQIFNQTIASGAFLNGITHDPAGNLYLTGFSSMKVYRFNTATRQSNIFVNNTGNTPNGIIYDAYDGVNPRLVMAGWGTPSLIKAISLSDSSLSTLVSTPFGSIDGIAKGKNGNFYISCWSNNSIQRYDSTFANSPTAMVTSGLSSPADIFYNQLSDTLAVPFGSGTNGSVNYYFFGDITSQKAIINSDIIKVFPNPTAEIININGLSTAFKNITINIYEIATGKLVYSLLTSHLNQNITINLQDHNFSSGIYLLELSSSNEILSRSKLTIE
ncbi:MAG TPA: T9SS type A sorting domain-containing protein [Bacteroidia bacterium]|nr:T9SS type A sorting domain-containing protein [Bacteroidia bacterium]